MSERVLIDIKEGIAQVRLNREDKLNALDLENQPFGCSLLGSVHTPRDDRHRSFWSAKPRQR